VCAWKQKNYEMNKCLSLVHLTRRIRSQSSGSDESTSWFLRCPKIDLDPPGAKSVSGRLTVIAAAPCSALRLNFRAGNHLPRTPQLRLPTSPFLANLRIADDTSGKAGLDSSASSAQESTRMEQWFLIPLGKWLPGFDLWLRLAS
jgi:hypothetical protein